MEPIKTIRGWMQEAERLALRRWAFGLDVLELGCYEGLSTAQLLMTANFVHAVDTFDGRGTPEPKDTRDIFHENMKATGNYGKLATWPGEFAEVLAKMRDRGHNFDLIFIDGAHDYVSVKNDALAAIPLLRDGGKIVFHDFDQEHPGVVQVIAEMSALHGFRPIQQVGSLVMMQSRHVPAPKPKKVCVAGVMPHRDGWGSIGAAWSMDHWMSQKYNRQVYNRGTSVLTRTFNELWCDALNEREECGFTHFCMLHNDVVPMHFWLDVLMEEMEKYNLDVISAVVPIKNSLGLTSCGLDTPGNPWGVRRLTLHEIFELPETFTAQDVPYRENDQDLLLNTGCWLMRFDEPWVEGLCFRQQDRIVFHTPTNKYAAESISEDWDFSRQLIARGCRVGATRKVPVIHDRPEYHTKHAWGEWKTDLQFFEDRRISEGGSTETQPGETS